MKTRIIDSHFSQWDLICDKDVYPTLGLVLFGASGFIGNWIFGYIQDRFLNSRLYLSRWHSAHSCPMFNTFLFSLGAVWVGNRLFSSTSWSKVFLQLQQPSPSISRCG